MTASVLRSDLSLIETIMLRAIYSAWDVKRWWGIPRLKPGEDVNTGGWLAEHEPSKGEGGRVQ